MKIFQFSKVFILQGIMCMLLLVAPTCLVAQTSEPVQTPPRTRHWNVGLTAGIDRNYHIVDMVYMTDMKFDKYRVGSVYGLHIGYAPVSWLSFNIGAVMIQKNYHMDHVFQYYSIRYSLPTTTTNDYLNVPVEMKLSVGRTVKVHAFGGVYGGYWLRSHRKGVTYSFSNDRECLFDEDIEFSDKRDNRIDKGFTLGAGISGKIINCIELGVEVRWYYGIEDIQKPYMRNLNPRYNTTFAIQAGLNYWL